MIPTRLRQQYNNGTVIGFCKDTGTVIIASNHYRYVGKTSKVEVNQLSSEQKRCGYSWPSVQDLHMILTETVESEPYLEFSPLCPQLKWLTGFTWYRNFVSNTLTESRKNPLLKQVDFTYSRKIRVQDVKVSRASGFLVPVIKLNGSSKEVL